MQLAWSPAAAWDIQIMLAPLFALALALPATGQPLHLELSLSGSVWYNGNSPLGPTPGATELGGGPQLDVNWYPRPIVDDDAAPSLQPFLQRATVLQVNGGGGRTDLTWPVALSPLSGPPMVRTYGNGGAGVAASGYFGPRRMLFAAGSFRSTRTVGRGHAVVAPAAHRRQLRRAPARPARARQLGRRAAAARRGHVHGPVLGQRRRARVRCRGAATRARGRRLRARRRRLGRRRCATVAGAAPRHRRLDLWRTLCASGSNVQDFVDGTLDAFAWVTRRVGLGTAYTLEWRQLSDGQSLGKVYSSSLQHLVMLSIVTRPF